MCPQAHCQLRAGLVARLVPHTASPERDVRLAASRALAGGLALHPAVVSSVLAALIDLYDEEADLVGGVPGFRVGV
jgi:hypothetical protein